MKVTQLGSSSRKLIRNVIRPEVRALPSEPFHDTTGLLKLDAMENPYRLPEPLRDELAHRLAEVAINRYPDPSYAGLKAQVCKKLGVPRGMSAVLGNGSDELISLLSVACAQPGAKVLAPVPGFVMYERSALLAGLPFVGVPLQADFTLDTPAMLEAIARHRPAITYLGYPNNPTGNLFNAHDMKELIHAASTTGLVVVDEAYQPFARTSFMHRLPEFENLIVLRTVSKLGLAGLRLGYMVANSSLLTEIEKVRPRYNINALSQAAAEFVLDHMAVFEGQASLLCQERNKLEAEMTALPGIEVFPSAANFLLFRVHGGRGGNAAFAHLLERKVLVKNAGPMHPLLADCLRVTVGTPEENLVFMSALRGALAEPAAQPASA